MKRLGDDILTPIQFLTKKQRKLIVETWVSIKDRLHFVQLVLIDVFRRYSHIQDLFRFRGVSWHELPDHSHFQRQCIAFANFLDYIIGFVHLNSSNFIEDACHQLGRSHAEQIHTLDEFPEEWWKAFEDSILHYLKPYFVNRHFSFLRRFLIGSYQQAWKILLNHVSLYMQEGFREQRKEDMVEPGEDGLVSRSPNRALELARWLEMYSMSSDKTDQTSKCGESNVCDDVSSISSEDSVDHLDAFSIGRLSAQTLPIARDLKRVKADKVALVISLKTDVRFLLQFPAPV